MAICYPERRWITVQPRVFEYIVALAFNRAHFPDERVHFGDAHPSLKTLLIESVRSL